jgi:HEAT repeat protein
MAHPNVVSRVVRWTIMTTLVAATSQLDLAGQPAACDGCRLRFDLALEKNSYEVGEPVLLSIRLTNIGASPVLLFHSSDVTGRHDGYGFDVFDEQGNPIADPGRDAISLLKSIGGIPSLAPGRSDERRLTLNYYVAPLKPGQYSIRGSFDDSQTEPRVHAESNRVVFRVEETLPGKVQQRVSTLMREMDANPGGVAPLLGFTGDVTAIPPLVDLLYRNDGARVSALDALLYLDRGRVDDALLKALRERGPRDGTIEFLVERVPSALMKPSLIQALRSANAEARAAAVKGLSLLNDPLDPALFAPLAAMLRDSSAAVRLNGAAAIGTYANQQALTALKPLVVDADASVSEQATIAIGWIVQASASGSDTRRGAIAVLRSVAQSGRGAASEQARAWLTNLGVQ